MEAILKGQDERLHRLAVDLDDYDLVTHGEYSTDEYPYRFVEETPVPVYNAVAEQWGYRYTTTAPLEEYITIISATKPVNIVQLTKIAGWCDDSNSNKIEIHQGSAEMYAYFHDGNVPETFVGVGNYTYDVSSGFFYKVAVSNSVSVHGYSYDVFVGARGDAILGSLGGKDQDDEIGFHTQVTGDFLCVKTYGQALDLHIGQGEDGAKVKVWVYKKNLVAGV